MLNFVTDRFEIVKGKSKNIYKFDYTSTININHSVVESFGDEWEKFYNFSDEEVNQIGKEYFGFLNKEVINENTVALDVGCGTGRWTKYLSSKVKFVEAIDPSKAIFYADKLLKDVDNVRLSIASTENIPFDDESFDFVMSVGVLHHIPDTQKAMKDCVRKVKKGGYFYVYLYYALDNRGWLFRSIFHLSIIIRLVVSRLPSFFKKVVCDILAFTIYIPLIYLGKALELLGFNKLAKKVPLSSYQDKSLFVIRNDALDRFGTSLEQRFTKDQIRYMMETCGLVDIVIPDGPVFWTALGKKL